MQPRLASTRSLAFLITIVAFVVQTTSARAATIVEVEAVSVPPGSSGNSFDVVLENTGTSAVTVAGFSFGLTSSSNVTFTDVTTATALTYIFNGNSLFGPDIVLSAGPGAVSAADNYGTLNAGFTVPGNTTVGLGHVLFNVAPAASGVIPVNIQAFPDSGLNGPSGNNISFTTAPGSITIATSSVPEPASLVLTTTGLLGVLALVLKRRRVSATDGPT